MALIRERITTNIPAELRPLIKARVAEEHYPSESAYILGLILFDLASRCRHKITSQIASEAPETLDKIVAEIVRDFEKQPRHTGEWLRHRIEDALGGLEKSP